MQSSRGEKKYCMGHHEDGKDETLRKMMYIMNTTNSKNPSISSDKALIQGLTSAPSKGRSKSNYALSWKTDAMEVSIKMMRKELKEQVKRHKANPKSSSRHVYWSKWQNISNRGFPVSEGSRAETIRAAAPTLSRLSSAVEFQRSVKQNEGLLEKDVKRDTDNLFPRRSDIESGTTFASQNKNIYGRHRQYKEEDVAWCEAESLAKEKPAQEENNREAERRTSNASSVQSFCSEHSKQAFPNNTTSPRKRSTSQSSHKANNEGRENVKSTNNVQEIKDDNEFVQTLTDPTLKTSLQRIIQKRRNGVYLAKSIAGLRAVNEEGAFSVIAEEKSDLDLESLMAKSVASSKCTWSGGVSEWENKSMKSFHFEASQGINQFDNPKWGKAYSRTVRMQKKVARSSLWPDNKIRTNKVETEETRIIKPLSSKTYRPRLTAKSRVKNRSNTTRSSPETSREKSHYASKEKEDAIREFMLMYAKVKQNKKEVERNVEDSKPVRMISATPEFVVKSAIGQFLTCVFPPEKPSDSSWENKERHEDKQRAKLLKIKICMQQLASIA